MISIYYIKTSLNRKMIKRKVYNITKSAGDSMMFSIGCLKFLDCYNFLAMPRDQMAKIKEYKTKKLYPYK